MEKTAASAVAATELDSADQENVLSSNPDTQNTTTDADLSSTPCYDWLPPVDLSHLPAEQRKVVEIN